MSASAESSSSPHYLEIDADQAGQRVDNFLISYLKGVPKSRIYRLLRKGEVRLNKGRIKADHRLAEGDTLRIPPIRVSEAKTAQPGSRLLSMVAEAIVYEDDYLLAVNKPSGLAVHGGSGIDLGLIETLRHHYQRKSLELIHRIDRETSGIVLVAKKRSALRAVQDQFRESQVEKHYQTLVCGSWPRHCHRVEAALLKNQLQSGERMVHVHNEGKASVTDFTVLERFPEVTLLDARPLTGRTHQIRVHTLHAGHPIVGDDKYGDEATKKRLKQLGVDRLFLHAAKIQIQHPGTGEPLLIEAPLADDLAKLLERLRRTAAALKADQSQAKSAPVFVSGSAKELGNKTS